jgi:hypothetical protein
MADEKTRKDNTRRYPRVFLTKGIQDFGKIVGLEVEWPGGTQQTGVLDISYIGAAIIKSSKVKEKYQKGDQAKFTFYFINEDKKILIDCEVIREDEKSLALYFTNLTIPGRQVLEKFLKQKLIGLNTHLVDPKFYLKEQGFNFWFHGPNQTNIFIWGNKKEISKATFEVNYEVVSFEEGKFYLSESKEFLEAPTEDYAYRVNNPENKKPITRKEKIVGDIVSLLSQVEDVDGVIARLSQEILKA